MGIDFSRKPSLGNDVVLLRPFSREDLEPLGQILSDPEVLKLTGSVNSTMAANSAQPVLDHATQNWYLTRNEQADRLDLAVVDPVSELCVGEVVLNDLDEVNRVAGFRILIGARGRNRGLGTAAIALILDYAFTTTELHRIELEVFAFNPRAVHVYERAGFMFEGTRRDALIFDGRFIDAHFISILATDVRPTVDF